MSLPVGGALDAGAELVELAGRVRDVEHLADRAADDVVRQLGAVLGPVGLDDAGFRAVLGEVEAVVLPEGAHLREDLLGRQGRAEPAVVAEPLDLEAADRRRRDRRRAVSRPRAACAPAGPRAGAGASGTVDALTTPLGAGSGCPWPAGSGRAALRGRLVRRAGRAVVDLVAGEEALDARAAGQRRQAGDAGRGGSARIQGKGHSASLHRWRVGARR